MFSVRNYVRHFTNQEWLSIPQRAAELPWGCTGHHEARQSREGQVPLGCSVALVGRLYSKGIYTFLQCF